MSTLFLVNVPHNCTETELTEWAESSGIEVTRVRLVRDLVAGVSPSFAYVEVDEKIPVADAVRMLRSKKCGRSFPVRPRSSTTTTMRSISAKQRPRQGKKGTGGKGSDPRWLRD